jgi:predicted dehydrogenase
MAREIRVGIIGISEGNGHPFSFSAIINGYSEEGLRESGWPVIYEYVRRRDPSEFGIAGLKITHAWTQDPETTARLCRACRIPNQSASLEDMTGQVDAVILARDDYENHFAMAMPFLEAGLPVFIDKPLTLDIGELRVFVPYLESGRLFSCSAMRFARELDDVRASLSSYGQLKLVRGAVLNSWEKYGVHLLDAVFSFLPSTAVAVTSLEAHHFSVAVSLSDGSLLQIDALGDCPKTFSIDIWGSHGRSSYEINDNFSMFRRMLCAFARGIESATPAIDPQATIDIMRILMAGQIARSEKRKVMLDEIKL